MKRVIKFYNQYKNNGIKFSDCSTRYEILPILVSDRSGPEKLKSIAKKLGMKTIGSALTNKPNKYGKKDKITHAIKLFEKTEKDYQGNQKDYYLGFISLNEQPNILKPVEKGGTITEDDRYNILNNQVYGVHDSVETLNDGVLVLMEDWSYFHEIPLLGYSLDQFQDLCGAEKGDNGRTFMDSMQRCDKCNAWDYTDDGYNYNHRMTDDGYIGINCGCYHEHIKDNYLDSANDHTKCIELDVMKELESEGKVEFIERFIGGMVDGRGGYYSGKSVREGSPEGILEDLLSKNPKSNFLFSHDESGQFQSYFSVWKVTKKGSKNNKKTA